MTTAQQQLSISDHLQALAVTHKPVAVITGATGGIGRALVEELAAEYAIVAQGRDEARLIALSGLGTEIYPVKCDLVDTTAFHTTFGLLPRIDALVHAAAIAPRCTFDDGSAETWSEVLHLNVTVPAELTRVVLPQLRVSTGTVVFLGASTAQVAASNNVVYAASKRALQAVADGIRIHTASDNIRVATVAPSSVNTPLFSDDATLLVPELMVQPETVARTIRHVIEAPADTQITEVRIRPRTET